MIQETRRVMWGLGLIAVLLVVADASYAGGGVGIGVGFGGGGGAVGGVGIGFGGYGGGYHGGGYHGGGNYGGGYHGGYYGGSGVQWGVNVPLSSDGSVRLGVGSGGYYAPYYRHHYYDYPRSYYGGYYSGYYDSYGGGTYVPSESADYAESAPPASQDPPLPTAAQVARMTDQQLAELLRVASEGYAKELGDYKNGETWKDYFTLAEIAAMTKTAEPPAAGARDTAVEALKRLDSSSADTQYDAVTKSWGFKALRVGLREYTLPPKERSAHRLVAAVQQLRHSLDSITTGAGWKKHLEIDALAKSAENSGTDDVVSIKQLKAVLAKFDAVSRNPEFQVVAELDGFAATQADLKGYVSTLQASQPVQAPPPPPPPAADTAQNF
jgi:hypothetical protein